MTKNRPDIFYKTIDILPSKNKSITNEIVERLFWEILLDITNTIVKSQLFNGKKIKFKMKHMSKVLQKLPENSLEAIQTEDKKFVKNIAKNYLSSNFCRNRKIHATMRKANLFCLHKQMFPNELKYRDSFNLKKRIKEDWDLNKSSSESDLRKYSAIKHDFHNNKNRQSYVCHFGVGSTNYVGFNEVCPIINDEMLFISKPINNSLISIETKLKSKNNTNDTCKNNSESTENLTLQLKSEPLSLTKESKSSSTKYSKKGTVDSPINKKERLASILYVDGCSLWKFPPWLVERLDLDQFIQEFSILNIERYRSILMQQLKSTATDLLLYQTVRREFLRTILVIELNNIVKLLDHIGKIGLDDNLKNNFFQHLRPIVSALDNPEKNYIPEMEEMAYVLDELYLLIAPAHVIKGNMSYHFNIVYCSHLVSHWAMMFNENCLGGIVDNHLIANESKYHCMVMITPQVYDESLNGDQTTVSSSYFRVETYFDVDRGLYSGFEIDFTKGMDPKYATIKTLECLIYTYLTREVHWVEDKNIFLLNGPGNKGNLDFTKIYYALLKTASI